MSSGSNFTLRLVTIVVALVAALVAAGCPGPTFVVQQYRGPQRPQETIATLRVKGDEPIRLQFLDDQDVAAPIVEDGRLHIEMLPGPHTIVVANANLPNEHYAPVSFVANPGRVYRVVFSPGPSGMEPRVFEVDRGNDNVVRDVTQAPATERAPAATPPEAPAHDAGAPSAVDSGAPAADAG